MSHTSITFDDVHKRYGTTEALRGVSFTVNRGECVALLGPNGAGKTTALEILLGLRRADRGRATVNGSVACTPQTTAFPDALTVKELVDFAAVHYADPQDPRDVLTAFDLSELAGARVGSLSGGEQRRVALALAFVANTDVVVLDEPSTGLDAESRRRLWTQLRAGTARRTTLFTTHYMEEAEVLATRLIVMDSGRVRFDGTPASFRERFGRRRIEYTSAAGERTSLMPDDADTCVRQLVREGVAFSELTVTQPSFEDIFLSLTGGAQ